MTKTEIKKIASKVIAVASVILIALILSLLTNLVLNYTNHSSVPEKPPVTQTAPLTPYQQRSLMEKVVVITDFKNSANDDKPDNAFSKQVSVIGSIDHAYLLVNGSVDNKPLGIYDKIYLKLVDEHTNEEIGGWLAQDKSIPTESSDTSTILYYDLSNVQYQINGNDGLETISGNWLKLLNQNGGDLTNIIGFNSTLREGEIGEVSIYYTCSTGSNCSIVVNK